jgi:hypothetical protein
MVPGSPDGRSRVPSVTLMVFADADAAAVAVGAVALDEDALGAVGGELPHAERAMPAMAMATTGDAAKYVR